jgi:hypothetical protein
MGIDKLNAQKSNPTNTKSASSIYNKLGKATDYPGNKIYLYSPDKNS